jgi:hypothetical protein
VSLLEALSLLGEDLSTSLAAAVFAYCRATMSDQALTHHHHHHLLTIMGNSSQSQPNLTTPQSQSQVISVPVAVRGRYSRVHVELLLHMLEASVLHYPGEAALAMLMQGWAWLSLFTTDTVVEGEGKRSQPTTAATTAGAVGTETPGRWKIHSQLTAIMDTLQLLYIAFVTFWLVN